MAAFDFNARWVGGLVNVIKFQYDHIMKKNKEDAMEYGCVCDKCGTVFTFYGSELKGGRIKCPNKSCRKDNYIKYWGSSQNKNFIRFRDDLEKEVWINKMKKG